MGKGTQFPKGVMMALEGSFDNTGKNNSPTTTVFEVKEIRTQPVDLSLFEIPAGYQKVTNLTKEVIKAGIRDLNLGGLIGAIKKMSETTSVPSNGQSANPNPLQANFDAMVQSVKNFLSQAQVSGPGAKGNRMAGFIEWIKRNFQNAGQRTS